MIHSVLRYEVPADDRWHTLHLTGAVVHVASRTPELVEVWAMASDARPQPREFRVFGTGQWLPHEPMRHVGTALTGGGALVWHLFERDHGTPLVLHGNT